MIRDARILVTGGLGFLGKHVCRELSLRNAIPIVASRRTGCDMTDRQASSEFIARARPDVVVHLAATVGGIGANMAKPGTFFLDNMTMGLNVIEACRQTGSRLVFISTVCGYPKDCPVPFREEDFFNGFPEPTNAPYGIAKRSLLVMCSAYRKEFGLKYAYLVPANLYGEGDHFEDNVSHVIPAMIKRFVEAKESGLTEVACWGSGQATRSFLYAPDAAKAIAIACGGLDYDDAVNLPGTAEISMKDLARIVADEADYEGQITWDASKPDGQPRRFVDGSRAQDFLRWVPETPFREGLERTIQWYLRMRSPSPSQT